MKDYLLQKQKIRNKSIKRGYKSLRLLAKRIFPFANNGRFPFLLSKRAFKYIKEKKFKLALSLGGMVFVIFLISKVPALFVGAMTETLVASEIAEANQWEGISIQSLVEEDAVFASEIKSESALAVELSDPVDCNYEISSLTINALAYSGSSKQAISIGILNDITSEQEEPSHEDGVFSHHFLKAETKQNSERWLCEDLKDLVLVVKTHGPDEAEGDWKIDKVWAEVEYTLKEPLLNQRSYRWQYSTEKIDEGIKPDSELKGVKVGEQLALRIQLENTGTLVTQEETYQLQFAQKQGPSCGKGQSWEDVTTSSELSYSEVSQELIDNPETDTTNSCGDGNCTEFVQGTWATEQTPLILPADHFTEVGFTLDTQDTQPAATYCLRVVEYDDESETTEELNGKYFNYPEVTFSKKMSHEFRKKLKADKLPEIKVDETNFQAMESPTFELDYFELTDVTDPYIDGVIEESRIFEEDNFKIFSEVVDSQGQGIEITPKITFLPDGHTYVELSSQSELRPGEYTLKLEVEEKEYASFPLEQDFTWGVLAINTNKATYLPEDTVRFLMTVLDDEGRTVCDADVSLEVTTPGGSIYNFSNANGTIINSDECAPNNVTYIPDYFAEFNKTGEIGDYTMTITAITPNGKRSLTDKFEVRESVDFDITRIGPVRIYPQADYEMRLKIKSNVDLNGKLTESVPASFEVSQSNHPTIQPFNNVTEQGYEKIIRWDIDWKAGETYELEYTFDALDISPEFYLLGPLALADSEEQIAYSEARQWQIASDETTGAVHPSAYTLTTGFNGNFNDASYPASNAYSSNDTYASTGFSDKRNKEYATNFRGFDFSGIPDGSVINSVNVYIERKTDFANGVAEWRSTVWADVTVAAALAPGVTGSIGDTQYITSTNPTSDAYWNYSMTTLPTAAQLKGANFGIRAQIANGNNGTDLEYFIDDIYIIVDYSPPTVSISGGCKQASDQATACTDTGTVRVAVNGNLQSQTDTTVDDDWTISGVSQPSLNDTITVFIEGAAEANEAVAVTTYDGAGDITGIKLIEQRLSIGNADNRTVTNTNLDQYDNGVGGEDVFHNVATNDLSIDCTDKSYCELFVKTGNTYEPSVGNATTHDLELETPGGVLTLGDDTIRVSGSWDNNGDFNSDSGTVIFTAASGTESIDSGGASDHDFNTLTLGESSGTAEWDLSSALDVNGAFNITYGTLDMNGSNNINISNTFNINSNGAYTKGSGTMTFDGSLTYTDSASAGDQDLGTLQTGSSSYTIDLGADMKASSLNIQDPSTWNSNGYEMDIDGDLTIGGTLDATDDVETDTTIINVQGNWLNDEATFTVSDSQVIFDADDSGNTINGGMGAVDFYDLTFNNSGGSWTLQTYALQVIHNLTLTQSTQVSASVAVSVDNNVMVSAGTLSMGGNDLMVGAVTASANGRIKVASGAVISQSSAGTTTLKHGSGGASCIGAADDDSCTGTPGTIGFYNLTIGDSSNTITTTIGGTSPTVTVANVLNITSSATLQPNATTTLTLSGTSGTLISRSGTFDATTNSGSTTKFTGSSATATVNSAAMTGSNAFWHLEIDGSSSTFTLGEAIEAKGNLTITTGTLDTGDGLNYAVTVGGSWTNNDIFTSRSGTVTFDSGDTLETIEAGSSSFYDITFNNSSGGWTIQTDSLTATHDFTITDTAASGFTVNSVTVEVKGTYSCADAEFSNTTWTSATLYLNSTTAYTVGSEDQNAETYSTLQIGADTDIRTWQSDATTETVNASGSLYSQDHANANGDLYIWGDYHTQTNDYWNYNDDFDGTDITGTPRQVDVRINGSANVTVDAGDTLESVGTSGNRTTVSNQGSGGYGITVATGTPGGTIDFQYTDFDYLEGTTGINIADGAVVTSLNYTAFDNMVNSGTDAFITVDSEVIHDGTKTFTGVDIANTGGGANCNVNRTGSDYSEYWDFDSHTGAFAGEANDCKNGANEADPGMLRWDDSTLNQPPNDPYDLEQRKDDGITVIAAGDWTSETTVEFWAKASDPDSSDTLYLCVEYKALGVAFDGSESCDDVGFGYLGEAYIVIWHDISGLSPGTEYHWRARVKDAASAYSGWVVFNVADQNLRDVGIDNTAPGTGTVNDGETYGSDEDENDGTMDTVFGSWSGFADAESGIKSYEYAIGTTAGGTDIVTWTSKTDVGSGNVFTDEFETGDLGEWDATSIDVDDLYASNDAAYMGIWGLEANIDDGNSIYVQDDFTDKTDYYARFYLNPNNLTMGSTESFTVMDISDSGAIRASVELYYSGSNYQVRGVLETGPQVTSWVTIGASAWTSIEIRWFANASGRVELWVDGDPYYTATGNTSGLFVDRVQMGMVSDRDSGTSGQFYMDKFTSDDTDYNGPHTYFEQAISTAGHLHTGQSYYISVRATNNAEITGSSASSDSFVVLPTFSFSIDSSSITFDELNPGNSWTDTKTTTTTTSTNAYHGYITTLWITQNMTHTVNPSYTISNYPDPNSAPTVWSGTGFGYTTNDSDLSGSGAADRFTNGGPKYAGYVTSGEGDPCADHTALIHGQIGAVSSEQFTITYRVTVANTQASGPYETVIVYIATPTF